MVLFSLIILNALISEKHNYFKIRTEKDTCQLYEIRQRFKNMVLLWFWCAFRCTDIFQPNTFRSVNGGHQNGTHHINPMCTGFQSTSSPRYLLSFQGTAGSLTGSNVVIWSLTRSLWERRNEMQTWQNDDASHGAANEFRAPCLLLSRWLWQLPTKLGIRGHLVFGRLFWHIRVTFQLPWRG